MKDTTGLVYADVGLINGEDEVSTRRFIVAEDETKRMQVKILVNMGFYMPAINENTRERLQLPIVDKKAAQTADGRITDGNVVAPIVPLFKNRRITGSTMVLPGDAEPLPGLRQPLIINPEHPYTLK